MESARTISGLYQALRPLLLRDVVIAAGGGNAASGGMETHALSSAWHTGQLTEAQAPWAATKNEWATALASHAALPDVHHAAVTAGSGISLSGQQVSLAPSVAGAGLTHSSGVLNVGAGTLIEVGADMVSLAPGTAAYQVPLTAGSPFTPSWVGLADIVGVALNFAGGKINVDGSIAGHGLTWTGGTLTYATITQRGSTTTAAGMGTPAGYNTITQRGSTTTAAGIGTPAGYNTITQRGSTTTAAGIGTPAGYNTITQRGSTTTAAGTGTAGGYNTITQRGSATSANSYTNSLNVARPTGVVENDVMIAVVTWWAQTLTPPSGWTQIGDTLSWSHPDGTLYARAYYRVAGASEPSSYAWGLSATNDIAATIVAYSNVDPSSPIAANGGQTQTSTSMTAPSVNAATAADMLLFLGAVGDNDAGTRTVTPPSGMTELADTTHGTTWIKSYAAHQLLTASGATGTRTATVSASARNAAFLVSLRPTSQSASNTSVTVNAPSGLATDDVLLATVAYAGGTLTPPSGWTQVLSQAGTGVTLAVFRKIAVSEPASYTWSLNSTDGLAVAVSAYVGVDLADPIGAYAAQANSSSTSMTAPTITPATAADMLYFAGAVAGNVRATVPSGMTEEADVGATGVGVYGADELLASGGATGTRTATLASATANAAALVALRPSSTAATNTSVTVNAPSGLATDDVLLATVAYAGGTLTPPSGWTQVLSQAGTGVTLAVFRKIAVSEPSSYTWSLNSIDGLAVAMSAYVGVDLADPIGAYAAQANSSSTSMTAPTITPATAADMLYFAGAVAGNVRATVPSGMTEEADVGATGVGVYGADELLASGGATGTRTATLASATANAAALVALRPSSTAAINTLVTVNAPSGLATNDVLLATVAYAGGTLTPPNGWSQVLSQAGTGVTLAVFRKIAVSEPSSYTWSLNSIDGLAVAMSAYVGVDLADPIGAYAAQANSSSTSMTAPTITPATAADMLYFAGAVAGNVRATVPSGMTEEADVGATGVGVYGADELLASGGATGTRTATLASATANAAALVSLRAVATEEIDTSVSVSLPTGTTTDDVLVAVVAYVSGTLTPPSGWTQVLSQAYTGGTLRVYRRTATGSEPSTYVWSLDSAAALAVAVAAYDGVDLSMPVDASASQANASGTSLTAPTVTTTRDTCLLLFAGGVAGNVRASAPGGMAEEADAGTTGVGVYLADESLSASGATGTRTATLASAAANAGALVALRPAVISAGGGGTINVAVAGLGLSVSDDLVTLTSSSNPGASESVLSSDANGYLQLVRLIASDRVRTPLLDTAAGNLTLQPAGDVMLDPAGGKVRLAANRALQSDNYASQTTGMRLTYAGEGDFRYLFADELHAKSFIADLEQALAGGQIISKSVAVLAVDFTLPAAGATGTLRVRDLPSAPNMAVFQAGDFVGLRQFSRASGSLTVAWAWGTVTAYADQSDGTQTWTFTRHATTPGAASGTIAAESLVLDFGTSGNGFYEVNAIDGAYAQNSPYWRVVTWATHPATQTVRVQGGNLRGLFGVANEYGLYAGDGTATTNAYIRLSNVASSIQNVPLSLYESGTAYLSLNANSGIQIVPDAFDGAGNWMTENRAITFHSELPGTDANYLGGVGCALDSTNLNIAMQAVDAGNRQTTAMIAAANSSAFGFLNIVSTSSGSYATLVANQISLETTNLSIFYSGNRYTIWHAGNDGTGSGLDADLLDGYHASSFWRSDNDGSGSGLDADLLDGYHASSFALLTGATFSGSIVVNGMSAVSGASGSFALFDRDGDGQIHYMYHNASTLFWWNSVNGNIMSLTYDGVLTPKYLSVSGGNNSLGAWSNLPFATGWGNYGGGYQSAQYRRFGDRVHLRGLVRSTGTNTTIATLPSGYRPTAGRIMLAQMAYPAGAPAYAAYRVDIDTGGNIIVVGWSPSNGDWVSLDCSFSIS